MNKLKLRYTTYEQTQVLNASLFVPLLSMRFLNGAARVNGWPVVLPTVLRAQADIRYMFEDVCQSNVSCSVRCFMFKDYVQVCWWSVPFSNVLCTQTVLLYLILNVYVRQTFRFYYNCLFLTVLRRYTVVDQFLFQSATYVDRYTVSYFKSVCR